jgi:diguanylate cyclase (GGDEF)-like protein
MKSLFGEQGRPAGRERAGMSTVAALVRHLFGVAGAGVAVTIDGRVWRGVAASEDAGSGLVEAALAAAVKDTGSSDVRSFPTPGARASATVTTAASRPGFLGEDAARVTVAVVSDDDEAIAPKLDVAFFDIANIALQIVDQALDAAAVRRIGLALSRIEKMSKTGQWHLDVKTSVLSWSDEVFRIHGLAPDAPPSVEDALGHYAGEARDTVRKHIEEAIATGAGFTFTLPIETVSGARKFVRVIGEVESEDGEAIGVFGVMQDVTEEKESERRLWWTANHDPLTGLPNRMLFHDRLARAIQHAKRFDEEIGLVILDVDNFKMVNDVYGHEAGDRLLTQISEILLETTRATDSIARLGGDEFAVILGDLKRTDDLQPPLERLTKSTEFTFDYRGTLIPVRMSMGIALFPTHGETSEDLYRNADIALFRTKNNRQRRLTLYEKRFGYELQARDELLRQVRAALSSGRIIPYYQPQFDLETGAMVGAEVLARWVRDERIVEAMVFLAAIDDYETAPMIGAQITRQVVENMATYKTAFADAVPFSMNISRSQIRNHEFLTLLTQLLNTEAVSYKDFIIEISEDTVTDRDRDHGSVGERLRDLADRGLSFSFDDFGTGFSSLIHIDSYSVRQVKIDRQLVQDIHFDPHKLAIVDGILRICSSLDIDVIAECVEIEEQATALRKLGIRHAQGNFFGRPMAFDEFLTLNESVRRGSYPIGTTAIDPGRPGPPA